MSLFLSIVAALTVAAPPAFESQLSIHQAFPRDGRENGYVTVYLPAEYHSDTAKRFPTLVLLHGLGGSDRDWASYGVMKRTLDSAIARGDLPAVIAVAPDGRNGYWSDWPDGRVERRFATLVARDLVPWVDVHYRSNGRRAIVGVSMGGFGALSIALQHRDLFHAVGSLSGALFQALPQDRKIYRVAFGSGPEAQERFKKINPINLIRAGKARGLPIWLDCGRKDAAKVVVGMAVTSQALMDAGVYHQVRLRDGAHTWDVWRVGLRDMLPWLGKQLRRP